MKAKKLPSGNWRVRASFQDDAGKQHTKSFTASTRKEAEFLANQFLMERNELDTDDCTIKTAIQRYISNRENVLSPSTLRGYRQLQRTYYSAIDNLKISKIHNEDIQRFIDAIAKAHSPKTTRNIFGLLKAAILSVQPSKNINVQLPQKKVHTYNTPGDSDVKRLIDACDGELKRAILLASVGTCRRGEICALQYGDIDGRTIHIHSDCVQGENKQWIYKPIPKTSASDRYIEFPQAIIDELGTGEPDERIVKMNPNSVTQAFKRLRNRLDIHCRFHDLRHYAASIMHALGIPDQYIMERGGWSSDSVLKSVYRNTLSEENKKFSDRANSHFEGLL